MRDSMSLSDSKMKRNTIVKIIQKCIMQTCDNQFNLNFSK